MPRNCRGQARDQWLHGAGGRGRPTSEAASNWLGVLSARRPRRPGSGRVVARGSDGASRAPPAALRHPLRARWHSRSNSAVAPRPPTRERKPSQEDDDGRRRPVQDRGSGQGYQPGSPGRPERNVRCRRCYPAASMSVQHERGEDAAMSVIWWILCAIVWVALAFWPARVAGRKGHSFIGYFIFSLFFFPAALIVAYLVPSRAVAVR
jgi:hypothetical protein